MLLWHLLACGEPLAPPIYDTATANLDDTGTAAASDTGVESLPPADYGDDGDFLYTTTAVLDFGLTLDADALASLAADPATDVHATLTFEDETYDVGVHLKGNYSFQDMSGKAAFRIDFHQWDPEQEFHGVRRLTLNNMVQDSTMSAEHTAYALYADLALPAPRHGYAQVTVNGELFGLYGIVETVDEQFVNRWFDDDSGNLYEGGYGGDIAEGCADLFDLKEEGEPTDLSDLQALIDTVLATDDDSFFPALQGFFDVDPLLDMWAAELVIADKDAYTTLGNNYLLYHEPIADRWTMIPWGPDQSFHEDLDVTMDLHGKLAVRCRASAACSARLDERIAHVLDVWEADDLPGFVASETARISQLCREDPRSPWGDYGCRDAQAAMRDWVEARPAVVEGELAGR